MTKTFLSGIFLRDLALKLANIQKAKKEDKERTMKIKGAVKAVAAKSNKSDSDSD